ncbi:hypothetical protein B0I35DRAFT_450331 [Stachybotrys elegans]|uniref:Rhodopsin domain-containing protein n=1 Tax=Stachybotrys elegans TaxID=80388 RepID=A0A8K0T0T3_9HYPO|nr:hypothetical protein B0I35DRAFT_450331 [Stachybotrys elegans]
MATDSIPNRGPELRATLVALLTLATVSIVLRTYVRGFLIRSFGFDDWCMLLAWIFFVLFVAFALTGIHYGTGRHHVDLEPENIRLAMKFWWFCYLWYASSLVFSKISIGHFLLRITIRKLDIWTIHGVMLTTVVTGVVFFFVTLFQCSPVDFFWTRQGNGSCISNDVIIALTYLYSACSVICDFTFALLPIALIWRLNMDKRSKIALIPIMLMACVASAAVVVRFPYVQKFKDPDFLWATLDIAIWSATEQGLAITAGSLATLRPLVRIISQRFGLSNGLSEIKDSDAPYPSGREGRSHNSNSTGNKLRGPFSLTTFMQRDDIELETESQSDRTIGHKMSNGAIRTSIWESHKRGENTSEEKLTAEINTIPKN